VTLQTLVYFLLIVVDWLLSKWSYCFIHFLAEHKPVLNITSEGNLNML